MKPKFFLTLLVVVIFFFSFLTGISINQVQASDPQVVYGTTQQMVSLQIDEDSYDIRVGGNEAPAQDGIVCKFDNPHDVYGFDEDENKMYMANATTIIWVYGCYETEEGNLNIPVKVITTLKEAPDSNCPYDFRGIHIKYSVNRYKANVAEANNKPSDIGGINLMDATKSIGSKLQRIEEKLLQDSISHIGGIAVQAAGYAKTWSSGGPSWDVSQSQPWAFRGNIKYSEDVDTSHRFLQFFERLRLDIPTQYDSFEFRVNECARSGYQTPNTIFRKDDTPTIFFDIVDFEEYDEDSGNGSGGSGGGSGADRQFMN